MKTTLLFAFSMSFLLCFSQKKTYQFTPVYDLETSAVKSQGKTGTCWSFSTASFLESEVYRITGQHVDLSEMYFVRKNYEDKLFNYVYRQGKAQLSEGGLAHDVIRAFKKYGAVPETVFSGNRINQIYDHRGLEKELKVLADSTIQTFKQYPIETFKQDADRILTQRIGKDIHHFSFEGKQYTPQSYAKTLKLKPDDYITITSFAHQPYHTSFILSVPDNYSNGVFYNLPLNDYVEQVKYALSKGYTLALDADVSEKTFSAKYGLAILPAEQKNMEELIKKGTVFKTIYPEINVTETNREANFLHFKTTDDHLMHIVGMLKDQDGKVFFKVKNSWGKTNLGHQGYIYMSEAYFRMKSISVLFNKKALKRSFRKALSL